MAITLFPKTWLAKPPLGVQINRGHPLAQGLIGCWLMNEGGGTTVRDLAAIAASLALNVDGTLVASAAWIPGRDGVAVQTSQATSSFIDVGSTSCTTFMLATQSWAAWVLTTTTGASQQIVAVNGNNLRYRINSDQTIGLLANGAAINYSTSAAITSGRWYHLSVTCGPNGTAIYINGVNAASDGTAFTIPSFGTAHFGEFSSETLTGAISQVVAYNRVLSAAEVLGLYTQPYCFLQPQSPRYRVSGTPSAPSSGSTIYIPAVQYPKLVVV